MIQFKRFFVVIYLHVILSVFLTYLNVWVVFKIDFLKEDALKVLFGVACTSVIYMVMGLFWGAISPVKKKLKLPLLIYMMFLIGLLLTSVYLKNFIFFVNGYIPFTYFIRNVETRSFFVLLGYGLSCILPVYGLYLGFQLSYKLVHRNPEIMD